jgi:HlyD family secretion protein
MKTIPRPLLIGAGGRARRLRRLLRLVALARRPDRCGLVSGNGRIEATEIDVATKLPGRVTAMLVDEGDFVKAGQPLAGWTSWCCRRSSTKRRRARSRP